MPCIFSGAFQFLYGYGVPVVFEAQSNTFQGSSHSTGLYARFDAWGQTFCIRCFSAAIRQRQDKLLLYLQNRHRPLCKPYTGLVLSCGNKMDLLPFPFSLPERIAQYQHLSPEIQYMINGKCITHYFYFLRICKSRKFFP